MIRIADRKLAQAVANQTERHEAMSYATPMGIHALFAGLGTKKKFVQKVAHSDAKTRSATSVPSKG